MTVETVAKTFPYRWRIFPALQGKNPGEVYAGTVRHPKTARRHAKAKAGRRAARLNRG